MKKTLISLALGLMLSIVPMAIYANNDDGGDCPNIPGCVFAGSSRQCDKDGYCIIICAYTCP